MGVQKVVWKDGLFVVPQHFQQLENYLLSQSQGPFLLGLPHGWGFSRFRVNAEMLAEGLFRLESAVGIMPDGTYFSLQKESEVPQARQVTGSLYDLTKPLTIYLALPLNWEGRAAYSDTAMVHVGRYAKTKLSLADEETGMVKETIEAAHFHFTFLFEGEQQEGYTVLPLACVQKKVSGLVEICTDFIPPLLSLQGSSYLLDQLHSITTSLRIRAQQLLQGRKQTGTHFAEFSSSEMTSMALLQTIVTYLPLLDQYLHSPDSVSPCQLQEVLAKLVGALSVFNPREVVLKLPPYKQDNWGELLPFYKHFIDQMLSHDHTPNALVVALQKTDSLYYECLLEDSFLVEDPTLYLGVSATISEEELGQSVAGHMKLSSREMLPLLMMSAMPGLVLTPLLNPSQKLATKEGFLYYRLGKMGDNWEAILRDKSISCYFPVEYDNLRIDLVLSKEVVA